MKLILLLFFLNNVCGSILDVFRSIGIEYEVYGEGRLIPEKQHCKPYTLDMNEFVNSLNTNEMSEYGREILKSRIYSSFKTICESFNITTGAPATLTTVPSKIHMRFMDRFELAWNTLKFERDLKSLFLENKINNPFLDGISKETIAASGSTDVLDFAHRTTVFPKKCNVEQMTVETNICFNISEIPQSGMVYALAHAGEFLHNEDVYAYYEIPEFVLITPQSVIPVDLAKCKVLFGTYIYCFEELDTQCDVRSLSDCPIYAYKSDEEFVLRRNFGTAHIYATTETELDLMQNGTKMDVPGRIFTVRMSFGVKDDSDVDIGITPHMDVEKSQFAPLLPESLAVLKRDKKTRLFMTQKRGTNMLSHKHYDQGAWDAVRSFFDRFI
ncbi:unnamed protein product [Caenorhabditis bovis]|uniref:Uncharacterized protein n=1 Tax=Caenorhabditis bovis TaxID=2654633 RepID=A0A8S1F1U1_9PELO|nr:unnamed protein product [Caenorhabditis bovis]